MKQEMATLREQKGEDGAPFEGDIPVTEIESIILKKIKDAKPNSRFIIDDYIHKSEDELFAFLDKIGVPEFILFMTAKEDTIK